MQPSPNYVTAITMKNLINQHIEHRLDLQRRIRDHGVTANEDVGELATQVHVVDAQLYALWIACNQLGVAAQVQFPDELLSIFIDMDIQKRNQIQAA